MQSNWKRDPIRTIDGIPFFSARDRYVENYEKIAADHVQRAGPGAENPWIPDDLWMELEASTVSLLRKHVRPGDKILDMGVGLGRVLSQFEELDRYGIDISLDYLNIAKKSGINVAFSRIEDCPYRDEIFDAVLCCDVLEHVFDLDKCCREILRVVRPGGIIVIRVPNEEDIATYLQKDLPYEYIHLRRFELSGLRLLFEKIFRCDFVESVPAGIHLQGPARLRLRPLPAATLSDMGELVSQASDPEHPLHLLKKATEVSQEDLVQWIYRLRDDHPDLYREVAAHLVVPIDINVVFRAPSGNHLKPSGAARRSIPSKA